MTVFNVLIWSVRNCSTKDDKGSILTTRHVCFVGGSAWNQASDGGSLVSFGDALLYGGLTFSKAASCCLCQLQKRLFRVLWLKTVWLLFDVWLTCYENVLQIIFCNKKTLKKTSVYGGKWDAVRGSRDHLGHQSLVDHWNRCCGGVPPNAWYLLGRDLRATWMKKNGCHVRCGLFFVGQCVSIYVICWWSF